MAQGLPVTWIRKAAHELALQSGSSVQGFRVQEQPESLEALHSKSQTLFHPFPD